MVRVNREEAKRIIGNGNFFSLKDDGDSAIVRFLFDKEEDIDNFLVAAHVIEKDGKYVDVDCLRAPDDPIENCPLCAERTKLTVKFYIPLWDEDRQQVVFWSKGKGFVDDVVAQLREIDGSIAGTPFKITRNGAAKSLDTKYSMVQMPKKADNKKVSDFAKEEDLDIARAGLIELTAEEMETYLDTGKFPKEESNVRTRATTERNSKPRRDVPVEDEDVRRRPAREEVRTRRSR